MVITSDPGATLPAPEYVASGTSHLITPVYFLSSKTTTGTLCYVMRADIVLQLLTLHFIAIIMPLETTGKADSFCAGVTPCGTFIKATKFGAADNTIATFVRTPLHSRIHFNFQISLKSLVLFHDGIRAKILNVCIGELVLAVMMHAKNLFNTAIVDFDA